MKAMDSYKLINLICVCIVNGFFTFAGIFLNSVVIISLWKSSQLRRKTCYFMILILSCLDLVVVLTGHPTAILISIGWAFGNTTASHLASCIRLQHLGHVYLGFQGFAFAALITMNIDRYLAIVYPFFYQSSVTKRRLLKFMVVVELPFLSIPTLSILDLPRPTYTATTAIIVAIPIPLMLLMNYSMFSVAKNKRKITPGATKPLPAQPKGASTCLLAIACLCMCASPFLVYSAKRLNFARYSSDAEQDRLVALQVWTCTILSMNSSFNSIIFAWRNRILYTEVKKLLNGFRIFAS